MHNFLAERKEKILQKWFEHIMRTYPEDTSGLFRRTNNRFTNPVAHNIFEGIEKILDGLLHQADFDTFYTDLEEIIKIRATQDFTPSGAVSFIFDLKQLIQEILKEEARIYPQQLQDMSILETQIDKLVLLSFDIYMMCRERIFQIKTTELMNMNRLYQRSQST